MKQKVEDKQIEQLLDLGQAKREAWAKVESLEHEYYIAKQKYIALCNKEKEILGII